MTLQLTIVKYSILYSNMDSYRDNISIHHIKNAYERISSYIHKTPIFTCDTLNNLSGRQLYIKSESFQKTGSFKARGALNAVLHAKETSSQCGFVTHSSGNHGQGLAYACKISHLPCTVVVPEGTSEVKINAMKNYGAEVVVCESNPVAREATCKSIAESTGRKIIHPYDNYDVMAGQGTVALELLEQVPDLDAIIFPIGGGGLASGNAVTIKSINPSCKIYLAEAFGKHLGPCLAAKQRLWPNPPQFVKTIADGTRVQAVGQLTFPVICDLCETDVFTVKDDEMIAAMKFLWERAKIVVEVTSCATLAAVLSDQFKLLNPNIKKIGVILSGGNVDLLHLPWL
ncbi:hypothetical protein CHUAL_006538 [Chamberlinius hualienensis]